MKEMNEDVKLDALREQMSLLKKKLDNQEIVTDRIIAKSMKEKMTWIKKYIIFETVGLLPILLVVWAIIVAFSGISWWNYAFVVICSIIDIYLDYRINLHAMRDDDYERCNLIETAKKLVKMKHQRYVQMFISLPLVIVWIIWSGVEAYFLMPDVSIRDFRTGAFIGGFVGGAIGTVAGVVFAINLYRKMQRTNDEMIQQINEVVNS